MANGSDSALIKEVKSLLEEDRAISTKSALKLSLGMQVMLHDKVTEQGKSITANTDKLKVLESKNIMMWIEKHPKLLLFIVTVIIVMTTIVDMRVVIAKALNIDL